MIDTKKILDIFTNATNLIYVFALLGFLVFMVIFDAWSTGFMGVDNNWVTRTVGFAAIGVILFRFYLLYSMIRLRTWRNPHIYLLILFDTLIIFGSQYAEYTEFGNSYVYGDEAFHEYFYLDEFIPTSLVLLLNTVSSFIGSDKLRHKRLARK